MTQPLHRTQVLLEPQQHQELTRIAAEQDRSLSDLLREIVRRELERRRNDEERLKQERREAIEQIRQHRRERFANRPQDAPELDVTELIHRNREERDDEIWEAAFGHRDHS
jgi:metal-responsive CopG/Arc/MetJ family transcriptional regulator